jgi:hypothetical protein
MLLAAMAASGLSENMGRLLWSSYLLVFSAAEFAAASALESAHTSLGLPGGMVRRRDAEMAEVDANVRLLAGAANVDGHLRSRAAMPEQAVQRFG